MAKTATKTKLTKTKGEKGKATKAELQEEMEALALEAATHHALAKLHGAALDKAKPRLRELGARLRTRYISATLTDETMAIIKDLFPRARTKADKQIDLRPSTNTDVDTEAIKAHLQEHCPGLLRQVFVKSVTVTYDHAAFEKLVKQGKVPEADALLAEAIVTTPGTVAVYVEDADA